MDNDNKELLDKIMASTKDLIGNIVYTVVFDTCNEMIARGADQSAALECANRVVTKYLDEGIKVRKKPAPRPKTTTSQPKSKPVDALTAALRKTSIINKNNITWIPHPDNSELSYTTDAKLITGYPVINNTTNKIIMVINQDSTNPLTLDDAKLATSLGFEVENF